MNVRNKIIKLSTESNEEVCGFLVGEDKIEVIPIKNVARNKQESFQISATDFLFTEKKYKTLAIYHSHPVGSEEPSEADKKASEVSCLPFVIYSKTANKFSIYEPENCVKDTSKLKGIFL